MVPRGCYNIKGLKCLAMGKEPLPPVVVVWWYGYNIKGLKYLGWVEWVNTIQKQTEAANWHPETELEVHDV